MCEEWQSPQDVFRENKRVDSFIDRGIERGMRRVTGGTEASVSMGDVNIIRENDWRMVGTVQCLASESMLLLRSGKKKYHLVKVID